MLHSSRMHTKKRIGLWPYGGVAVLYQWRKDQPLLQNGSFYSVLRSTWGWKAHGIFLLGARKAHGTFYSLRTAPMTSTNILPLCRVASMQYIHTCPGPPCPDTRSGLFINIRKMDIPEDVEVFGYLLGISYRSAFRQADPALRMRGFGRSTPYPQMWSALTTIWCQQSDISEITWFRELSPTTPYIITPFYS